MKKKKKVIGYKHGNKVSKLCFGDSTKIKQYNK